MVRSSLGRWRLSRAARCVAGALALVAPTCWGQVIAGNNAAGGTARLAVVDAVTGSAATLTTGTPAQAWGIAFDPATQTLYWSVGSNFRRGTYDGSALTDVTTVGTLRLGTTSGQSSTVTSLAFDTRSGQLIAFKPIATGSFPSGLYTVNPTTGVLLPIVDLGSSVDLGGMDYDAASDSFIVANDGTSTALVPGPGLYRMHKPLSAPTFTLLSAYPPEEAEGDVDGIAVGNGRVYLVNDTPTQPIYVYNLASGAYEASLPSPLTGSGPGITHAGATWVGGSSSGTGANVGVSIALAPGCVVPAGSVAELEVTITNAGPEAADDLVVRITTTENGPIVGTVPSGMIDGTRSTIEIPSLASGGSALVRVQILGLDGIVLAWAEASAEEPDPVMVNNVASGSIALAPGLSRPTQARAVVTSAPGWSASLVPGVSGVRFDWDTLPGRPTASPDGSRWILPWDITGSTLQDAVVVVGDAWGATRLAAREGVTTLPTVVGGAGGTPPFTPAGAFDPVAAIDDRGEVAFSGRDSRGAFGGYVVKSVQGVLTLVAQEAVTPAPIDTGGTVLGAERGSVSLSASGQAAAFATVTDLPFNNDGVLLLADLVAPLAQEGVLVPTGQLVAPARAMGTFDAGSASRGFFLDASHARWLATGLLDGPTGSDDVVIVDGAVVSQEGAAFPGGGFSAPVFANNGARMEPDGSWTLRATNLGAQDFAAVDGAVVARTGDPVTPAAIERLADVRFNSCFFLVATNPRGDVAVGAYTDAASPFADAVVVLNGSRVLLREGDAVDMDGDGLGDDGLRIRTFIIDAGFLTDEALYVMAQLRTDGAALCGADDSLDAGAAMIRVPLPDPCPCDADYDRSGSNVPDLDDLLAFFRDFNEGDTTTADGDPSADVDCTGEGSIADVADIVRFFEVFVSGC